MLMVEVFWFVSLSHIHEGIFPYYNNAFWHPCLGEAQQVGTEFGD